MTLLEVCSVKTEQPGQKKEMEIWEWLREIMQAVPLEEILSYVC